MLEKDGFCEPQGAVAGGDTGVSTFGTPFLCIRSEQVKAMEVVPPSAELPPRTASFLQMVLADPPGPPRWLQSIPRLPDFQLDACLWIFPSRAEQEQWYAELVRREVDDLNALCDLLCVHSNPGQMLSMEGDPDLEDLIAMQGFSALSDEQLESLYRRPGVLIRLRVILQGTGYHPDRGHAMRIIPGPPPGYDPEATISSDSCAGST